MIRAERDAESAPARADLGQSSSVDVGVELGRLHSGGYGAMTDNRVTSGSSCFGRCGMLGS